MDGLVSGTRTRLAFIYVYLIPPGEVPCLPQHGVFLYGLNPPQNFNLSQGSW